ncbi:CaiB/BaiF CoA transferase family protein [Bacillus sp. FJAT-45350]|uniref:CaiB/BaiF CoA transferase family protein n=1 Tax=Bacillus sp. FJAT-45350 TaxID=2011014 RepID=UPI000BB7C732|nr:CaiB/BaiF CoA-transferase family protein [Bacillus sp. FJAT-45350]
MLDGIRIVDFSFYLPGPYATLRLAEMGAEVIKVEPPEGDPARLIGEKKGDEGLVFLANNSNKKSITLNLKNSSDQEKARELIKTADVVIESFRPGVTKRLGIDYERAKQVQPEIIYCSISGYGQSGAMSSLGSHDLNYMSLSGALAQLKSQSGEPVHPTNTFADLIGSLAANEAILSALLKRERTGTGEYIDLAITDVMASLMANHLMFEQEKGKSNGIPLLGGEIVSYKIYETKDNRYISLAALEKKFWENFCAEVGREDWLPHHFSPADNSNEIYQEMKELFSSRTMKEWTQFGLNVDCCLTPILETRDLAESDYFKERGRIFDTGWGSKQVVTQPHPTTYSRTRPPRKGEHTDEILATLVDLKSNKL